MDPTTLKDSVKLKLGRNLLLFQRIEKLLKIIVTRSSLSGYSNDLLSNHERQRESVSKRTLGMVARNFIDGPLPPIAPDSPANVHVAMTVEFDLSDQQIEQIEALVAERNNLVHHFIDDVDFNSAASLAGAESRLDDQEQRLLVADRNLRSMAVALSDGRKALAEGITEHLKNS